MSVSLAEAVAAARALVRSTHGDLYQVEDGAESVMTDGEIYAVPYFADGWVNDGGECLIVDARTGVARWEVIPPAEDRYPGLHPVEERQQLDFGIFNLGRMDS